jgi:hypothetical protein
VVSDELKGWLGRPRGWLAGWLADWLADWLTGWLTDWLTPWRRRVLHGKLIVTQLFKKFLICCRARGFIAVFTTAHEGILFWSMWIYSSFSHPISLGSVFVLFIHLYLSLPSSIFLQFLRPKCCMSISHACYMTRPFNRPGFFFVRMLGEEYKLWSSLLCNFLHRTPVSSTHNFRTLLRCGTGRYQWKFFCKASYRPDDQETVAGMWNKQRQFPYADLRIPPKRWKGVGVSTRRTSPHYLPPDTVA